MKSAKLQDLIDRLDKIGWKKGYEELKQENYNLESRYAAMCADPEQYTHAKKLDKILAIQSETLVRLKVFAKECRGVDLE